jgi:hypothetical protein
LESKEFKDLVQLLNPETRIVKADQLKNGIMDKFFDMKRKMVQFFNSIDSRISFTTDIWTSPNDLAFMAITAHWISPDFKLHSILMDFIQMNGSHTGENIEKAFSQSLIDFKVLYR